MRELMEIILLLMLEMVAILGLLSLWERQVVAVTCLVASMVNCNSQINDIFMVLKMLD
jgi:hypothetical protein